MAPYGPVENKQTKKKKKESSDYVSIIVKMCSNESQTNPYDI